MAIFSTDRLTAARFFGPAIATAGPRTLSWPLYLRGAVDFSSYRFHPSSFLMGMVGQRRNGARLSVGTNIGLRGMSRSCLTHLHLCTWMCVLSTKPYFPITTCTLGSRRGRGRACMVEQVRDNRCCPHRGLRCGDLWHSDHSSNVIFFFLSLQP
jgi:hypothetical protein